MRRRLAVGRHLLAHCPLPAVVAVLVAACGGAATGGIVAPRSQRLARWLAFAHLRRPLDLVADDDGRRIVATASGRLWALGPIGAVQAFAPGRARIPQPRRRGAIHRPLAGRLLRNRVRLRAAARFRTRSRRSLAARARTAIRRLGEPGLIDGLAFDTTGEFGHRLLVTINAGTRTTVDAIGCAGIVHAITRSAPRVEGGIAVAPATFGRFAGDLIAPGETSGRIFAITPRAAPV